MVIIFWWVFVFFVIKRYTRSMTDDDDEPCSFSDSDSDSHYVPESDADLYDESIFSPRWKKLTDEEKQRRLSLELAEYFKESEYPDS